MMKLYQNEQTNNLFSGLIVLVVAWFYYTSNTTTSNPSSTPTPNASQTNQTVGRYVKVVQTNIGKPDSCVNLAEIRVLNSSGTNIAFGKQVTQSSFYSQTSYPSSNFVDEKTTDFGHTQCGTQTQEWVSIDLGSDQQISSIQLTNRTDCCQSRAIGLVVYVISNANTTVYTTSYYKCTASIYI